MSFEEDAMKTISPWLVRLMKKRVEQLNKVINRGIQKSLVDIGSAQEEEYRKIFNDSVKAFYDNYQPKKYKRKESMYNMLVIEKHKSGLLKSMGFDEKKMSGHRPRQKNKGGDHNHDGLYTTVFKEGYHGGAKFGDQTVLRSGTVLETPHPDPGVPHWRAGKGLRSWGQRAPQDDISPYNAIKNAVGSSLDEGSELYEKISDIRSRYVNKEILEAIAGGEFS